MAKKQPIAAEIPDDDLEQTPAVEEVQEPVIDVEPVEEQTPEPSSVRSILEREQLNLEGDDESVLSTLAKSHKEYQGLSAQLPQLRQYADYGRQYAQFRSSPDWQQFQEWQQQRTKAQQPATPEKPKWSAPEYDPRWLQMVDRDESGNLIAKPGVMPDIPHKIMAYAQWKADQEAKFFQNPGDFVYGQLEDRFNKMLEERLNGAMSNFERQQNIRRLEQENSRLLYATDAQGNVMYDVMGNPMPSEVGTRMTSTVEKVVNAVKSGDAAALVEFAKQYLAGQYALMEHKPAADESAEDKNRNAKGQFLKAGVKGGGTKIPNRNGGNPATARKSVGAGSSSEKFRSMMMAALEAEGIEDWDSE